MKVPSPKGAYCCMYLKTETQPFTKCIFKTYHRGAALCPECPCAALLLYKTISAGSHRSESGKFGQSWAGRYMDVLRDLRSPELVCSLVSGLGSRSRHPIEHN